MPGNGDLRPPHPLPPTYNFHLFLVLSKAKLNGPNYIDRMRNLMMTLSYENTEYSQQSNSRNKNRNFYS